MHSRLSGAPVVRNQLEELLEDMARVARTYASFLGTAPMQREWLSDAMGNMRSLNTTQGLLIWLIRLPREGIAFTRGVHSRDYAH